MNAREAGGAALAAAFLVLGWAFVLELAWNFVFPGNPITYLKSLALGLLIRLFKVA